MDMVQTGTTSQQRRIREDLVNEILKILDENNNLIRFNDLTMKLNERSSFRIENLDINDGLRRLQQEGKIIETGDNHRRTIKKIAVI